MRFHDPSLLLLIPFALLILFLLKRKGESPAMKFPHLEVPGGLKESLRVRLSRRTIHLKVLSLLFIVLALARPQSVLEESKKTSQGIDIILALDVSTSMLAQDQKASGKSRLDSAKEVATDFIRARGDDRIGVVIFGARAYTVCPLTLDHGWIVENLKSLKAGMVEDGTAIGSGIMSALNRLRVSGTKEKIVIMLTDGRNNAGEISPAVAAETARALKIKIYTIGIGSKGTAFYPAKDPLGADTYRPIAAEIDEQTLSMIAARTEAKFFRAIDEETLMEVYREIDRLEKSAIESKVYYKYEELFPVFLSAGIALLLLEFILTCTFLRKIPY